MMNEVSQELTNEKGSKTTRWAALSIGTFVIAGLMLIFGRQLVLNDQGPVNSGLAPDFNITTYDGTSFTLSELRGQIVVVNFWASWCIPCRDEAPILETAWQRYRDRGVVFIGIAYLDTDKESLAFLEEYSITYPNGPDIRTEIARDYRLAGVPETFFVGRDGKIVDSVIGPLTERRLISALEMALTAEPE